MKKRKVGKYSMERLMAVAAGTAGSLILNNVVRNYTDKMDEDKAEQFKKVWPFLKIGAGYYMTTQKNLMVSDAGLGLISEGVVEAALTLAPDQFQINGLAGFWGNKGGYYNDIGSAYQNLPLDAAGSRLLEETVEDNHAVMGYDYIESEAFEDAVI